MTFRPPRHPDVMTADELALREAQVKDTHVQVRCSPEEKREWVKRAGGKRKLSELVRHVMNRHCLDPLPPIVERGPDDEAPLPDEPRVVYDP